jgi:hypothetical protein
VPVEAGRLDLVIAGEEGVEAAVIGVVDEDLDGADLRLRPVEEPLRAAGISEVRLERGRLPAGGGERLCNLVAAAGVS